MAALAAAEDVQAPARGAAATRGQMIAWALYDWASSPFFAVIITFVFAQYFVEAVAQDTVAGTAQWGWAITLSALIVAVLSPLLGAVVDAGFRRKPWLFLLTTVCAVATAGLWFVMPERAAVGLALVLIIVANSAGELAQALYNAMLPDLARPSHLGRWSGWGWGLGYVAGIAALGLMLVLFVLRDPPALGLDRATSQHVRVTGPFIGFWFFLFALPLFWRTPDRLPPQPRPGWALAAGLGRLRRTLAFLRGQAAIRRFLLAQLIYIDGLNTLFAFGGIYAAGTFGMATREIIVFGIALNLTAGIGAVLFAWLDDRLGSKPTILWSLLGLLICGLGALVATDKTVFWAAALFLGVFIGPVQAASRSLMARLSPPDRVTEMFGLYAFTGKVTSFMGPFLFGTATWLFETQRAGMATVLLLLAIGAILLVKVEEPSSVASKRPSA